MNSGSVVQIGGAVRHSPLPPLLNFAHNNDDDDDEDESQNIPRDVHNSVIGGFIGEGYLAWRAIGATIEVFDAQTCIRQAAWTFGAMLHYTSPVITCVCGIGIGPVTHIVIGVDIGAEQNPQGMVGILSLRRSRIIRAFRFQHKVTNVCMITGGEKVVDPSTLAVELRSCQGLLAVATAQASLYLVDLGLDLGDEITSDEMSPASFVDICVPDPQADVKRNKIISSRSHPILCLSDNMNIGKTFRLLGPDDHILYEAPSHCVNITCLMYIPQLASLIVGYSFGSFQLINLNLITIDCVSPYEDNMPPVFSFAYQEPENDPKSFVYLWVCRSHSSEFEYDNDGHSIEKCTCSLYSMHYDKKEWIEGHGLWYQSLSSMSPRFSFKAVGGIGEKVYNSSPSKLICAMSVAGTTPLSNLTMPLSGMADDALSLSNEEAEPVPELSLCLFCWEANVLTQGKIATQHYVAIFDINQWYQSQMPSQLRLEENKLCAYMSFHILDKVPSSADENLLGGMPLRGSWSRHSSRAHCEKMWYPSALSYEFNLLTSESLATYHCPSVQQSTISTLLQQGPGAIVHPGSAFKMCIFSGILSNIDVILTGGGLTTVSEREHILNTALEYHLLSLLTQCIVEFSEGRFSHMGCTSQLLMDWAWNKLKEIKYSSDTLCLPLVSSPVDGTVSLSAQNLINLHQNFTYLSHLSTIFASIRDNAGEITTLSAGELEGRVQIANLLKLHLQVILWFYHCGLLPQFSPEDALEDSSVPFPAEILADIYEKRRKEIKSSTGSEILLIDSIMEDCGRLLAEVWDKERGEGEGSLYPPTSLHSILSMYLLPGIPSHTKHRIVQYLFLDMSSILSENYSNVLEELVKFPSSFSLSPSLIKLTQAFWLIDNKEFQAGLSVLLDPLVNPSDITQEQHRRVIKAFLYQGEEGNALTYTQIRKPPKCELDDIRINLTILLANGRIRESFHYQRKHRVASNAKQLLNHMFLGCEQLGRLESVVHLPLSPEEEECFVSYLKMSKDRSAQDILLVYYLQKSRYAEISSLHESTHRNNAVASSLKRQNVRSAIVQGYMSHLPDVRAQLIVSQKAKPARTVYSKPQPFSARIRQCSYAVKTPKLKATAFRSPHPHISLASKTSFTPYTPFRSKAQRRKAIQSWQEEMGLESPKETRKAELGITRIVFPSCSHEGGGHSSSFSVSPIANTSQAEVPLYSRTSNRAKEASLLQESITKLMEGVLRKSLSIPTSSMAVDNNTSLGNLSISQDVVSLLKTPPVKHNRSILNVSSSSVAETPQSILKVRKILEQSQNVTENESPIPSFPRHRLSVKKSSVKKLDKVVEVNALTPKQLRFDLPSNRRLSMDEAVKNNEDEELMEDDVRLLSSLKRKRGDSPPLQQSLSRIPSPRKPLPRYSSGKHSLVHLRFGPCSDSEEEEEEIQESVKSVKNFTPSVRNKDMSEADNRSYSAEISTNLENMFENNEESDGEKVHVTEEPEPINSSESLLDDSFHSVEENEEELAQHSTEVEMPPVGEDEEEPAKQSTEVEEPPIDEMESFFLQKNHYQAAANDYLISEVNIEEANHNTSRTVEERSETRFESDEKYSVSERFEKTLGRVEICSSKVSLSETSIVRETLLLSSSEDSYRPSSPKTCINMGDPKLPDTSIYNISSTINKFMEERTVVSSNHSVNNTSLGREVGLEKVENQSESTTTFIAKDIESMELGNEERIENSEAILNILTDSYEVNKQVGKHSNDFIHKQSDVGVDEDTEVHNNNNSSKEDESLILKFSDSEEEEILSLKSQSTVVGERSPSSMPLIPSLSQENTILVDANKSVSQADTILIESSKSLSTCDVASTAPDTDSEVPADSEYEWNPSVNASSIRELPSDLENAKPLRLTTQEREWVDQMLKDPSLSFNHFTDAPKGASSLNKSLTPVLEFSDEETEMGAEVSVTANGVSAEEDGYASDDSEKTVEFDISQFVPTVQQTNSTEDTEMDVDQVSLAVNESEMPLENITDAKDSESVPPDEVHNPVKTILYSSLQEKDDESATLLYLETNPDNNNIQKDSILHTPLKEESIVPLTPSRKSRRLSGLSADVINETGTPSTPLRRSTRLNTSTPTKIETTPLRRRRRTSGASDIVEISSNVASDVQDLKLPTTPSSRLGLITDFSSIAEIPKILINDVEDARILSTPSRRRRRVSGSSDIEERTSKILATPSRRRRRASGVSDTSETANVVEEATRSKDVEERLGLLPVEESRIAMKENLSPSREDPEQEINTPIKHHQDTPRRRSARLSGVKENLGTIIEDAMEENQSVTPKKLSLGILTPKRSRRKSSSQNVAVIEPLLETIKEDSELSTTNGSVQNLPQVSLLPNSNQELASPLPVAPSTSSSVRRSRKKSVSEPPPESTQLPVYEDTTTPIAATPVTATSLRRTRRTSGSDASEHTHTPELPNSPELPASDETTTALSLSTSATPVRRSRRRTISETSTTTNTSTTNTNAATAINDSETPLTSRNSSSAQEFCKIVPTRTRKYSQSPTLSETSLISNSSLNSVASDVQAATTTEDSKTNYTLISPDETCVNATIKVVRRYSEKHVNSVLSNSKHSTSLRQKSFRTLRTLSIPPGFEFAVNDTLEKRTTSDGAASSHSPESASTNMEEEDEVFEGVIEDPSVDVAGFNDVEEKEDEVKPSPLPVYNLLEGGEDVALLLPRRAPRAKSRSFYRRSITSMKVLNSSRKETLANDEDERPLKKVKNGLAAAQEGEYVGQDLKGGATEDSRITGFLFQNPEVISAAEAVSEVFDQLTKEHERIVSETFVFSPPFSLSENRRKKLRESARNSRK